MRAPLEHSEERLNLAFWSAAKKQKTVRLLYIVARSQPELYDHLRKEVSESEVRVLLDRRRAQRRQRAETRDRDRRRSDRRRRPEIDHALRSRGFVVAERSRSR